MNAAAPLERARWRWRRWLYAIGLVFLAQVILIFLTAERQRRAPRPSPFRTTISLAMDPASEKSLAEMPALSDPTLFALPNLHGFSGAAWLTFAPPEHEFTAWAEPQRWLQPDTASLGKAFLAFVSRSTRSPLLIADKPLPAVPSPNLSITNSPLAARSEYRIEGELARRPLLNPLVFPPWPHSEILTNTVVQLLVDSAGDTLPTLLSSCGRSDADQFALRVAAKARFEPRKTSGQHPRPAGEVTWGTMIVRWHTVPVSFTNIFSNKP